MANLYLRSTDGSDADNGTTWALAKATIAGIAAIDAAGDAVYVSQNHSESTNAGVTIALAGTFASPVKIICGNDAAEPPTAVATTGVIATGAGAYNIDFTTGVSYVYGLTMKAGVGSSSTVLLNCGNTTAACRQYYESCEFWLSSTGTGSRIGIGSDALSSPSQVEWRNCNVKFGATAQAFAVRSADFIWNGGSIVAGSSAITTLFAAHLDYRTGNITVDNVDLSNGATGLFLVNVGSMPKAKHVFRNCKLPASWSGSLTTGSFGSYGPRVEMYNCDSADTNYRLWIEDYSGSIKQDTGIYLTAGASDGTTNISWKMASTANAEFPAIVLYSPEIVRWNETTGSSVTVTVEFLIDSATTLNNNDVWLEVSYNGTSGSPLGTCDRDSKVADVLTTVAECTTGAGTGSWTGEGGTAKSYKLTSTFTPQEKGFFIARVALAKASTTIYVDPVLTVS